MPHAGLHKRQGRHQSGQQGFTLISVIMAAAIGLLLVKAAMDTIVMQNKAHNAVMLNDDLENMRNYVRSTYDCSKTKENVAGVCAEDRVITIYSSDNRALSMQAINMPTDSSAKLEIKGSCQLVNGASHLQILVRPQPTERGPRKHPLTGQTMDWQDLFSDVPLGCAL